MHKDYEDLLYIKTSNTSGPVEQSKHYNQYEATPYSTLYILFEAFPLQKTDGFVDFGCGKGRLLYYVHHLFGSAVTGIEMNEILYKKTLKNKRKYLQKIKRENETIYVERCLAEKYEIKATENVFYFFNPFSVEIFMSVVSNILDSVEQAPRKVSIILYYPTMEYINYLASKTPFLQEQEVRIPDLYPINNNERFVIYTLDQ